MRKEVSTPKPFSATLPVKNNPTTKTKNITKKETPSNNSQQLSFSARILQYRSHQYVTNLRSRAADHLLAKYIFQFQQNHIYIHKVEKKTISSLIIAPKKHVWLLTLNNKLGRLDQGNNLGVQYNDTVDFVFRSKVPNNHSVTCASFYSINSLHNKINPSKYCGDCCIGLGTLIWLIRQWNMTHLFIHWML